MGWIDWSWWMKEEEKPAEPLVLGAELECEYGSQRSFLMVETDGISINDLPKACVEDSIAHRNIHPFGKCLKNDECYFKMDLEERWVNAEPQTERVNGKEIITTSSTLICKASGMAIRAVTSGQDGRFARFQQFLRNMERKYPGLRETLEDPYGSVYLEGNYEMALQFLEEQIEGREEGLEIVTLYDPKNLEGAYILAALERLMTDCEVRSFEGFMNDLRDTANQHGMQGKEGWDQNYLNEAMMELLRKDCKETAERIETNPVYRGIEKQKMFGSWLRECTEAFAYTTVMYSSALAEGNSSGRRMEGDKGRGAVKKGEEKGKESGSVKGSSEMGGERVDGKGGSKSGSNTKATFASEEKLLSHFDKHGGEFKGIFNTADEYLQGAQDVMQNGYKVEYAYKGEIRTGYVQFMGNNSKGNAKFAFVGTNNEGYITTFHTESGKSFWKMLNGENTPVINPK